MKIGKLRSILLGTLFIIFLLLSISIYSEKKQDKDSSSETDSQESVEITNLESCLKSGTIQNDLSKDYEKRVISVQFYPQVELSKIDEILQSNNITRLNKIGTLNAYELKVKEDDEAKWVCFFKTNYPDLVENAQLNVKRQMFPR